MKYNLTNRDGQVTLSIFAEGEDENVPAGWTAVLTPSSHPFFKQIETHLLDADAGDGDLDPHWVYQRVDAGQHLADSLAAVTDQLVYADHRLLFQGEPVEQDLQDLIMERVQKGEDGAEGHGAFVNFLVRLAENPSMQSREHLFRFVKRNGLVLTPNGMVLAYKGMNRAEQVEGDPSNLASTTASQQNDSVTVTDADGNVVHTFDQSGQYVRQFVGATVRMPRSKVDDDNRTDCSRGLHVGGFSYAQGFGNVTTLIMFDPADAVAVPRTEDQKMRISGYKVLREIDAAITGLTVDPDNIPEPLITESSYARDVEPGQQIVENDEIIGTVVDNVAASSGDRVVLSVAVEGQDLPRNLVRNSYDSLQVIPVEDEEPEEDVEDDGIDWDEDEDL